MTRRWHQISRWWKNCWKQNRLMELVRAMAGMKFKALSRKKADDVSETLKDQVKAERDACKKELQKLKEQFFREGQRRDCGGDCRLPGAHRGAD